MKIFFLVNPRAGDTGAGIEDHIHSSMQEAGMGRDSYCIEMTEEETCAKQIINAFKNSDTVIGMGGDGTVHEIIKGYMETGDPSKRIGLIPAGTGNDFFRHFCSYGEYRKKRESYISRLIAGKTETHSVWSLGNIFFTNYFSIGYDAAVISAFDAKRKKRGKRTGRMRNYIAYALLGIANMNFSIKGEAVVETDSGEVRSGKGIIISNIRRYAGGSCLPWQSGETLCAVPFRHSLDYLKLMLSRVRGKPVTTGGTVFFKEGIFKHLPDTPIQIDGEVYTIEDTGMNPEIRMAGTVNVLLPRQSLPAVETSLPLKGDG